MFKNVIVSGVIFILAVSFTACSKKGEAPQMPPSNMGMGSGEPGVVKVDRTVIVPKQVAAKWKAVKVAVEDKVTRTSKEYVVSVGADLAVPNTNIRVKVLAFLPDFRMGEQDITSASDKPNNPAVQVEVREPGKEDWKGWLYSLYPQIHPFVHERVALTLVSGVEKSL